MYNIYVVCMDRCVDRQVRTDVRTVGKNIQKTNRFNTTDSKLLTENTGKNMYFVALCLHSLLPLHR